MNQCRNLFPTFDYVVKTNQVFKNALPQCDHICAAFRWRVFMRVIFCMFGCTRPTTSMQVMLFFCGSVLNVCLVYAVGKEPFDKHLALFVVTLAD